MNEPNPVRHDKGAARPRETRETPRPGAHADESCPVVVRYYGRMRLQRVYPLAVELARTDGQSRRGTGSLPAVLRPIIPGALVVPSEERIDASVPGSRAVFQVTPLARRRLPDARIEVHQKGRPVQEIALDMRVTTQRLAWLLLVLAVLVPWGLTRMAHAPLTGDVYDLPPPRPKDPALPQAPKAKDGGGGAAGLANDGLSLRPAPGLDAELVPAPRLASNDSSRLPSEAAGLLVLLQPGQPKDGPKQGGMPKGGMPIGGPPGGVPPQGGPPEQPVSGSVPDTRPGSPDEVLRNRFRSWARTTLPDMGGVSKLIANDAYGREFYRDRQRPEGVEGGGRQVVYNDLASWISVLYRWTITLTEDGLAVYVCLVLLALSFIAWLVHRATRAYQRQSLVFAGARSDAGPETPT